VIRSDSKPHTRSCLQLTCRLQTTVRMSDSKHREALRYKMTGLSWRPNLMHRINDSGTVRNRAVNIRHYRLNERENEWLPSHHNGFLLKRSATKKLKDYWIIQSYYLWSLIYMSTFRRKLLLPSSEHKKLQKREHPPPPRLLQHTKIMLRAYGVNIWQYMIILNQTSKVCIR
jgi:hypothetical protein